jgi:hypothetical protein
MWNVWKRRYPGLRHLLVQYLYLKMTYNSIPFCKVKKKEKKKKKKKKRRRSSKEWNRSYQSLQCTEWSSWWACVYCVLTGLAWAHSGSSNYNGLQKSVNLLVTNIQWLSDSLKFCKIINQKFYFSFFKKEELFIRWG